MYIYRSVLLLIISICLFSSAIMEWCMGWWTTTGDSGYHPWIFWFIVILAGFLLQPGGRYAGGRYKGLIAGLMGATSLWFFIIILPQMADFSLYRSTLGEISDALYQQWHRLGMITLAVSALLIYLASRFTAMPAEEHSAARACQVEGGRPNEQPVPEAHDIVDIVDIADTFLPWDESKGYVVQDIHFMESRLKAYHSSLNGLAGELDDLRRHHRDTLNSLPMALCSVDAAGDIMLWNQAMSQMTGIPAREVLGRTLHQIAKPWRDILSHFARINSQHLPKHGIEMNGQRRYFNLHKAHIDVPVPGHRGNTVMLLEDHTENQLLEDQLLHSERLASIGQLAAGIAHEIGNPITAIDCLAQELKALSEEDETRKVAGQVLEQTQRVSSIMQMLLSYSHNGRNRSETSSDHEPVDLCTCIQESISLLQLGRKGSNIRFLGLCDPEHKVMGDRQKLQQVFINLLNNAVDASGEAFGETFGKKSTITIRTSASTHTVKVEVEDQGHGIPASIQERLFEPFFTTKEAGKGTGLGLALTWNIIEEHFGTIQVISPINKNLKKGTRFEISLPRHEP